MVVVKMKMKVLVSKESRRQHKEVELEKKKKEDLLSSKSRHLCFFPQRIGDKVYFGSLKRMWPSIIHHMWMVVFICMEMWGGKCYCIYSYQYNMLSTADHVGNLHVNLVLCGRS